MHVVATQRLVADFLREKRIAQHVERHVAAAEQAVDFHQPGFSKSSENCAATSPCGGTEHISTAAGTLCRSRYFCTTKPPIEWPIRTGAAQIGDDLGNVLDIVVDAVPVDAFMAGTAAMAAQRQGVRAEALRREPRQEMLIPDPGAGKAPCTKSSGAAWRRSLRLARQDFELIDPARDHAGTAMPRVALPAAFRPQQTSG